MDQPRYRLGDLQLAIMKVLWEAGAAAVTDVHHALADNNLAYTTVATMLRKMEAKGLVRHREEGRRFIYLPAVTEEGVTRSMADDVLERVFEGNLADMVSHLLDSRSVSPAELDALEKMIAKRRKQTKP
jgi:BlaI family transcriptional regulator, penicillinase repressor